MRATVHGRRIHLLVERHGERREERRRGGPLGRQGHGGHGRRPLVAHGNGQDVLCHEAGPGVRRYPRPVGASPGGHLEFQARLSRRRRRHRRAIRQHDGQTPRQRAPRRQVQGQSHRGALREVAQAEVVRPIPRADGPGHARLKQAAHQRIRHPRGGARRIVEPRVALRLQPAPKQVQPEAVLPEIVVVARDPQGVEAIARHRHRPPLPPTIDRRGIEVRDVAPRGPVHAVVQLARRRVAHRLHPHDQRVPGQRRETVVVHVRGVREAAAPQDRPQAGRPLHEAGPSRPHGRRLGCGVVERGLRHEARHAHHLKLPHDRRCQPVSRPVPHPRARREAIPARLQGPLHRNRHLHPAPVGRNHRNDDILPIPKHVVERTPQLMV